MMIPLGRLTWIKSPLKQLSKLHSKSNLTTHASPLMTCNRCLSSHCPGCGIQLQSHSPATLGYVHLSKETDSKRNRIKEWICQRCHALRNQNHLTIPCSPFKALKSLIQELSQLASSASLVLVLDSTDLSSTDYLLRQSSLTSLLVNPKHNLHILLSKRELLPLSISTSQLHRQVHQTLKPLLSTMPRINYSYSLLERQRFLQHLTKSIGHQNKHHPHSVYLIGLTNVGKSFIFNQLLDMTSESLARNKKLENQKTVSRATSAVIPGTTLDFNSRHISFEETKLKLVDTPGIFHPEQLTHFLTIKELEYTLPRKNPFIIQTISLRGGQSLFFGGLIRIDILPDIDEFLLDIKLEYCMSNKITLHKCKTIKADEFYRKHMSDTKSQLLVPPIKESRSVPMPPLIETFSVKDPVNEMKFGLLGLGWISLSSRKPFRFRILSIEGRGVVPVE